MKNSNKKSLRMLGQFSVFIGIALLVYIFWGARANIQQVSEKTLLIVIACANVCVGSLLIQRNR